MQSLRERGFSPRETASPVLDRTHNSEQELLPLPPLSPAAFAFIVQVDEAYTALTGVAPHLGGHLLYTGNLNEPARALTIAANIAGAATLAADPVAGKQALRDGVIDFLVTSLDEALRILKNEIRKRQPAAVCVAASPQIVEQEMEDRGVLPDLVAQAAAHVAQGAARPPSIVGSSESTQDQAQTWLTWRVTESPAQWLPKLDALALAILAPAEGPTRRWLQQAPRYLGRLTQNARVVRTTQAQAHQFIDQLKAEQSSREINAAIEVQLGAWANLQAVHIEPT
jgi:hypothetical protein